MTTERDELLPCPFCGGAFKLGQEPADNHPVGGKWYLYHEYGPLDSPARKCLLSVAPHFDSATEATTAWNTRTTPSKDTGAVVRLANELRERSRFPSGVARISEAKAREIAESALSTPTDATAVEAEREACAALAKELPPCPFCGKAVEHRPNPGYAALIHHPPYDRYCPLSDKLFVAEAWSTRSPSTAVERPDKAFSNAVWEALKGDHSDLRKQAIILRAHREALRASPPPGNREAVLEEAAKALEAKAAEAKAKHNPQRNVTALLVGQVYEDAAAVVRARTKES